MISTETNPTYRQMAQFIIGLIWKAQPMLTSREAISAFNRETGVGRATFFELVKRSGADSACGVLKRESLRKGLEEAYRQRCVLRGDAAYQAWTQRAYVADHRQLNIECATAWWHLATAMDEKTPPGTALCLGIGAQKVLWNWLLDPPKGRPPKEISSFLVSDDEVREKVRLLIDRLQQILTNHPKAPANLFPTVKNNPKLIATSYQLLRARLANDAIGWAYKTAPSDADRANSLEKVYREGEFSSAMQWLASLQPDEIAWRNGPFMLASHASDWSEAARTLERLLHHFPEFLTTPVSGLAALSDDLDALPGLAAAYTTQNGDLDGLRGKIDQLRQKNFDLDAALKLAEQNIRSGQNYGAIIAHIRQKGLAK